MAWGSTKAREDLAAAAATKLATELAAAAATRAEALAVERQERAVALARETAERNTRVDTSIAEHTAHLAQINGSQERMAALLGTIGEGVTRLEERFSTTNTVSKGFEKKALSERAFRLTVLGTCSGIMGTCVALLATVGHVFS